MQNTIVKRDIALIAHNLRSCHNVGSLLRTAEGLGVDTVYLTGYTPFPMTPQPGSDGTDDNRLPHQVLKLNKQIHKTALGAEHMVRWEHQNNVFDVIQQLHHNGYVVAAVEQTTSSTVLPSYPPGPKIALIVGREVDGLEADVMSAVDLVLEIPMFGSKESFNVVQAAAMALYHCRFMTSL